MKVNEISGDCTIEIDGANYVLNFRSSAMIELETQTEMPMVEFMERLDNAETRKFVDLKIIFFVFFSKHHRDLNDDDLMNLMDMIPIEKIAEIVLVVINAASPDNVVEDATATSNPKNRKQRRAAKKV